MSALSYKMGDPSRPLFPFIKLKEGKEGEGSWKASFSLLEFYQCPRKASVHVRDEAPRTWEKQWRSSSSPSESKATYLTVCDSQLGKVAFILLGQVLRRICAEKALLRDARRPKEDVTPTNDTHLSSGFRPEER